MSLNINGLRGKSKLEGGKEYAAQAECACMPGTPNDIKRPLSLTMGCASTWWNAQGQWRGCCRRGQTVDVRVAQEVEISTVPMSNILHTRVWAWSMGSVDHASEALEYCAGRWGHDERSRWSPLRRTDHLATACAGCVFPSSMRLAKWPSWLVWIRSFHDGRGSSMFFLVPSIDPSSKAKSSL